jgi:hypothetical protein
MQGLDQVLGSSGVDLGGLGAKFGLSPEQTRSAMGSLMPAVLGGFHKQAQAGDPADVAGAAGAVSEPDTQSGNDILGRIFGSKDVSRQVADHASGQTGVPSTVLKAMLPIVAAMVARHVASNGTGSGGGGLGGLLASVLGGGGVGSGGLGGLGGLGSLGGLGGGGANPLDEILGGLRR